MSTPDDHDQPDEQAAERPIGVEEQKTIESQEEAGEQTEKTEEPETITPKERVNEILQGSKEKQQAKEDDSTRKLFDQFTKHFQISKVASDKTTNTLKHIQKQLTQMDKMVAVSNKQQVVTRQLVGQVKAIQKQLDKVASSVNRLKNISIKRKK
jgi:hypothetical protein